jgi:ribose transport system substrate-binding protein
LNDPINREFPADPEVELWLAGAPRFAAVKPAPRRHGRHEDVNGERGAMNEKNLSQRQAHPGRAETLDARGSLQSVLASWPYCLLIKPTAEAVSSIRRVVWFVLLAALMTGTMRQGQGQPADPTPASRVLLGKGPHGEDPSPADSVSLTPEEIQRIRALHAKAGIVLNDAGSDGSRAQVAGLTSELATLGVDVIAITNARFKPEKQVADLEAVLTLAPQVIVSVPIDPVLTAPAYRKALQQGVKLVFMSNVPQGFAAGKDYVSLVSADNYGEGVVSAHLMARFLKGKGRIGILFDAADFFATRQRDEGFRRTMAEHYPEIRIAAEQGVRGPSFQDEADRAASALLGSHPGLDGIWSVWDLLSEGVVSAARAAETDQLVVTTVGLGASAALEMAQDGRIKGLGAQRPYDQGVTEARLAGYGLLGKPAPAYVALPAFPVTRDNLLEAWKEVYHAEAPAAIKKGAE